MGIATSRAVIWFYVAVVGLSCGVHALWPTAWDAYALPFLFGSVLSVGLVHGCLDYELEARHGAKKAGLLPFLVRYVLQMAAVAAVWLVAPGIALGLFLVYTGWHFGETDMGVFGLRISPWQTFLYGFGLIIWILAMHMPETLSFLADLAIFSPTGKVNSLLTSGQTLIKAGAFGCMVAGFIGTEIGQKPLVFLLVALVVATTAFLPLLVGFAAYFGFWHSLHSMHVIKADLQTSYAKLLRQALPYLLVSVVGTGALVGVLEYFHLNAVLVLFIFISALTAPHAQVMHGAFRRLAQRQWPEAQV